MSGTAYSSDKGSKREAGGVAQAVSWRTLHGCV